MLWRGKNKFKHIEVAPGGASYGFGDYNTLGRTYFVNNITGASTNDGTTWDRAMAQPSTAVTASEVYRQDRGSVTTNDYIRNTIVVQGTGTAYTALTTLPQYTDVIGLGADVRGNGAGIARIGADSGTGYGVLTTTTIRGVGMYNLQFQGGNNVAGSQSIFKVTHIYRAFFEDCSFMTNGDPTASPAYGFRIIGKASGLHMNHCHWGNAAGYLGGCGVGFSVESTHFHVCLIENCHIIGSSSVILIASGCVNTWGSIFRDNYLGGDSQIATIGVNDDSTTGRIIFAHNYINATTDMDLENNATGRLPGNFVDGAFVAAD